MTMTTKDLLQWYLQDIHDSAMELAAAIEFGPPSVSTNPENHPVHQWAMKLIKDVEEIRKNTRGELDIAEVTL